jgi:hypothetical protein
MMTCQSCLSSKSEFLAEINIHFPGWSGLTKPTVRVFPSLQVCLRCGLAEFAISGDKVRALADGIEQGPDKNA